MLKESITEMCFENIFKITVTSQSSSQRLKDAYWIYGQSLSNCYSQYLPGTLNFQIMSPAFFMQTMQILNPEYFDNRNCN